MDSPANLSLFLNMVPTAVKARKLRNDNERPTGMCPRSGCRHVYSGHPAWWNGVDEDGKDKGHPGHHLGGKQETLVPGDEAREEQTSFDEMGSRIASCTTLFCRPTSASTLGIGVAQRHSVRAWPLAPTIRGKRGGTSLTYWGSVPPRSEHSADTGRSSDALSCYVRITKVYEKCK